MRRFALGVAIVAAYALGRFGVLYVLYTLAYLVALRF
jgi:hypothetical protein